MEIRQLRYFVSVAESRSFSEASRQSFLSQSAISQQIKQLEDELGTQLFLRNTHSVTLTGAGDELLPLARQAIKAFDSCHEHINGLRGLIAGQLNIGMTEAMEPYIRHTVTEMLKRYPKLHINMYYKPTHELRRMLLNHELDMAFTINTATEGDGIESKPIVTYRICAIMNSNHPLAKYKELAAKDLENQGIIMPERTEGTLRTIRQVAPGKLEMLNIRAYSDSPNSILNLLEESNFVTFLSPLSVVSRPSLVARKLKELPDCLQCYVHTLKSICPKQSSKVFLDIMTNESIPYYKSLE